MKSRNESNKLAKECIVTALIELMKAHDFHSITITDLTKKAGVSRMAYYRNYTSKEDILNKFVDEVGADIHEKLPLIKTETDLYNYYYALLDQLSSYNDLAITTYKAGLGEVILSQITKQMTLTFPPQNNSPAERYRCLYLSGAFYNIFIEWLKNGQKESCADMARICLAFTHEGFALPQKKGIEEK
jgi:AcrR family transcriptional regulator